MSEIKLRDSVLHIIQKNWPIHVRETVQLLNWDPKDITNVSKVRYHFKKLEEAGKIRTKKIGRALVAWPVGIERMRAVYDMLKD
jgi:predicted transcriptional regulator